MKSVLVGRAYALQLHFADLSLFWSRLYIQKEFSALFAYSVCILVFHITANDNIIKWLVSVKNDTECNVYIADEDDVVYEDYETVLMTVLDRTSQKRAAEMGRPDVNATIDNLIPSKPGLRRFWVDTPQVLCCK